MMRFGKNSILGGASVCALIAGGLAAPAHAQDTETSTDESEGNVIVVTARKKEESILETPLSVTAIAAGEIEDAGLQDITDVAAYTPGFQLESYSSIPGRYDSTPFIRGVVFDNVDALRQTVSLFVDGVFISGGNQMIGLDDIQRVEVIKGPQSAQFGRSTFAGAVNYITRDPSSDFGAKISAMAATRDEYEVIASVEGGLIGDVVSARLSGRFHYNDGHYTNFVDPSQKLGEEQTWSVGATVLIEPSSNFRTKIRAFYSEIDDGPAAGILLPAADFNVEIVPGGEPFFRGVVPELAPERIGVNSTDADFEAFITDARMRGVDFIGGEPDRFGLTRQSFRASLDSTYEFDNGMTLTGIFGYSNETALSLYDFDSTPNRNYTLYAGRKFEDIQAELRLSGSSFDGLVDWSFGANHYRLDFTSNGAFGLQGFGQSSSFGDLGERDFSEVKTTGIFGKVAVNVTDRLTIGAEGRYQWDKIDEQETGMPGVSVPGSPNTFKNFLPRIIVDYQVSDYTLIYASYSEGNLPGGFNTNFFELTADQLIELEDQLPGAGPTYAEETLKAYEIGWKQSTIDGSANFAVSAYYYERVGQVTNAVGLFTNPNSPPEPNPFITESFFVNDAATDIYGLELEANVYPSDELSLRATLAYTDAEISAFPASGDSGDYEDVFLTDDGFIGTKAERYPPFQVTLSGTYEQPVGDFLGTDTSWFLRGDMFFQDQFFLSTPNLGKNPSSTVVNLRTGFRGDAFSIEAFVTNLTKETAPAAANNTIDLSANPFAFTQDATQIGLREKRQFGVRTTFEF